MLRMTTNMLSAARLIAHPSVNGRYQSKLQMDQFPVLGHSMTVKLTHVVKDALELDLLTAISIPSTRSSPTAQTQRLRCTVVISRL